MGGDLIALHKSFVIKYLTLVALWSLIVSQAGTGSRKDTVGSKIRLLWEGGGKNPRLCILLGNSEVALNVEDVEILALHLCITSKVCFLP